MARCSDLPSSSMFTIGGQSRLLALEVAVGRYKLVAWGQEPAWIRCFSSTQSRPLSAGRRPCLGVRPDRPDPKDCLDQFGGALVDECLVPGLLLGPLDDAAGELDRVVLEQRCRLVAQGPFETLEFSGPSGA